MSGFLGSRISLISKSDIRYVGTLHEINSEESTVSLENVRSFGTEGRKGRPQEEIAPSDQVYEYIVFRGSDVKDLRIEEHPGIKENKPPAVPDDPAILGARPRLPQGSNQNVPPQRPPQGPQGQQFPPNANFQGGPPGQWGRGGPGPMPGPAFGNMPYPYPPPSGWFPGQGFPPGPGGPGAPGPWQNQPFPPGGPQAGPGPQGLPQGGPGLQGPPQPAKPESKPVEAPAGPDAQTAPTPPVESKPSTAAVKAAASNLGPNGASVPYQRTNKVNPVIPLTGASAKPFSLPNAEQRSPQPPSGPAAAPTSVQDATSAARAAVANAMAQLGNGGGNAMDNLTNKVNEMKVNAGRPPTAPRGRGRGGRVATATPKVEVPDSDFDFAEANKKFNKDEGKQPGEEVDGAEVEEADGNEATGPAVYNKSTSFFDNISSEAKDRAANNGQKPGGREWRGEEQRKNMETFGQGSVDGGHRNYRGRGRGRAGGRGRGGRGRGGRPQYQATGEL
ncbi:G2/M phase checkpoint control protein Sum2, putative [Cordyceps militaris CM01]|uniref:G2/M phase checkpoint control protein Sum2, putative n=1 Tax=Cordyceps militaris (strain CM01) TaxID=983644 RepID=G3J9Z7_CORMM|nr:G2/M phase checkpoint control protein Sum2, putative [Cordyceps militaris CM01]EGX94220.1 G2/M phase checkpoint control protein Sum2, putative [Cordyceps militaris CM01]